MSNESSTANSMNPTTDNAGQTSSSPDRSDHNIWPLLTSTDALALRSWLSDLGFADGVCVPGDEEGTVRHSEMLWPEGGRLMVCTADDRDLVVPAGQSSAYVVTADPRTVFGRAERLGAKITRPLEEASGYTSLGFSLETPEGHSISFGTYAGLT